MPANLFFGTSIPTTVIVLKKNRQTRDVLFIDASREFVKGKNQNIGRKHSKILETYAERKMSRNTLIWQPLMKSKKMTIT